MAGVHKTVRVEAETLEQLDQLARENLVPAGFTGQVNAALGLLIDHAAEQRARRAARLVAADHQRARATYRQLQGRRGS